MATNNAIHREEEKVRDGLTKRNINKQHNKSEQQGRLPFFVIISTIITRRIESTTLLHKK